MPQSKLKSLSAYRRRLKQRGVVRVEVHVRKNDAALVRGVARALCDPRQRPKHAPCCVGASVRSRQRA